MFIALLESALLQAKDFFTRFFLSNPFLIFIKGNTNKLKSFEIVRLFNIRQVKKVKK